ncbi:MAG: hypothetical protein GFH27_549357n65 [Chloroflexi bacterium AL-W]|nr:hypothetical protein [Chloroflexi bacterium AL-N10]NOK78521.1 hypothetical protein [Chloroflexi bacterium AL-N5]NOK85605.1 hypothetical protein [Chloroflexi bacterium AL-W]NOK92519.1 hypothetical protein [Chloroflexi bacterium AL-N15]
MSQSKETVDYDQQDAWFQILRNMTLRTSYAIRYPWLLPILWILLSGVVLFIDYRTGPLVEFPILFIVPVVLAGLYSNHYWALGLASVLPLFRVCFYLTDLWQIPWSPVYVSINTFIRIMVLSMVALLLTQVSRQKRKLEQEVSTLHHLLPICSHCKKIRNPNNTWFPLEQYITEQTGSQLTHSICPECARIFYSDIFEEVSDEGKQI